MKLLPEKTQTSLLSAKSLFEHYHKVPPIFEPIIMEANCDTTTYINMMEYLTNKNRNTHNQQLDSISYNVFSGDIVVKGKIQKICLP